MSNGDVRRSQLANFFSVARRNEGDINHRLKKSQEEISATPSNLLTTQNRNETTSNKLAIKLNRLKDK